MDEGRRTDNGMASALRRGRIVILVLGAAVIAYGVIGALVTTPHSYEPPIGDDAGTRWVLRAALAVVALINLSTVAYVRRAIIEHGGDGDGQRSPLATRLLTATIIAGAFAEGVGVYGLVLTLIGGELLDVIAFGTLAMIALAVIFPKRSSWEERARNERLMGLDAGLD